MHRYLCVVSLICILISCQSNQVDFNEHVRPILNQKCMSCHGGVRAQGDLSFLFKEDALKPAKSGKKAIVPGRASSSELMKRITHEDIDLRMPLDAAPLSQEEIDILEAWIDDGAEWTDHWAYVSPVKDKSELKVNDDWPNGNIDKLVRSKLDEKGLSSSPSAPKSTIIRRLSFDLIGLPPTSDEAETFLDDNDESAYEKAVDKYLTSPHYGERWASVWLDLARYADSQGYQKDHIRKTIWRYRDYVINAFNEDKPFDQFTIEQLAGDLLPEPTNDQLLATAFHRNTMTNDEGGTDDEEYRVSAVMDRLNTTFEVWQSTTISCVQCHSHPYDPIRHKEYYNLYAFFNNTADTDKTSDVPKQLLYSPIQRTKRTDLGQKLEKLSASNDTVSTTYQELLTEYLNIKAEEVPVMEELSVDSSRQSFVFERGNWLVHGEEVEPKTPSFLPAFDASYSADRLGLAQWLIDGNNPLTARVIVNRFWEQIFGIGLVETVEDFGTQGMPASNQELLDYLANQFVHEYKWSVKSLLKEILMSQIYRQSSHVDSDLLEIDPYNKFLARGPRFRLSAEAIRDQALAVSGLLNREMYGPSVMPHQPDGVWNVIRHVAKWEKDTTGQQYRRGLYTFWRRVSPYPSMMTFDAPSREFCVSRRIRTNTPLQALVTLNDPVYTEASEHLAHLSSEAHDDVSNQIDFMYQRALMKSPNNTQLGELMKFYMSTLNELKASGEAQALLINNQASHDYENKALSQVANVILNTDEFLMKS